MSAVTELENKARAADEKVADTPSLHGTLAEGLRSYTAAEAVSSELLGKNAPKLNGRPLDTGESVFALRAARRLDATRYADITALNEAALLGEKAHEEGVLRPRRGRINADGLISEKDGSSLTLPADKLESLAANTFAAESSFSFRAPLFLSPELVDRIRLQNDPDRNWNEVPLKERNSHIQAGYEIALALGVLRRSAPEKFDSFMRSSKTLHSLSEGLQPALKGLPLEFQTRFVEKQKDVAWSWRNQLEPGKSERAAPELSLASIAMRNKMGLGMLEYLLPTGKETLEYLRYYGQQIIKNKAEFRRSEISEEHFNKPLVGVPLTGDRILNSTPELLIHLAREHHELWRFARELSWLESDPEWHQPERYAHVPWEELNTATKNRDILNIFGVSFMLGTMNESDFNILASAASPKNPLGFAFDEVKKISS